MFGYSVESSTKWNEKPILVYWEEDNFPQRYDYKQNKWVIDKTLNRVFIGELYLDPITKEQAEEIIKMNS